jgi:hypothetical protein
VKVRATKIVSVGDKVQEAAIMEQWPTAKIGQGKPVDENTPF